ncbi:toxin-antitoxin system TumE family protein [Mangrovibrevibacter kandeliae]|uniref:toxin-antitoxin system TumE family protein n=1 Tax=Mangrovibrevibacter kandeliae TaxID=2968473 RepID=UPI0021177F4D|nr:DUF6516 family protein [Aurantimonas sp. CSK15Z-1]MCQ8782252.1 DUF6516 family protein [Aurantimonas sp. CSK15Z-1]
MKATLLLRERRQIASNAFTEAKIWHVPQSLRGSGHRLKYSLALVVDGVCVLRYDNEAGKGDHRHVGSSETAYVFETPERLMQDFLKDCRTWLANSER